MNQVLKKLSKALQKGREFKKLSKIQAAQRANLGRNFIYDIESGKETAQIGKVLSYAQTVGVTVSVYPENNPYKALEEAISCVAKSNKELANRIISSLNEEEKSKINLPMVQIRQKSAIKKIVLSV